MNDPLLPQGSGISLTDFLIVAAVLLVAVGYLYRKLWRRSGKPTCSSCPGQNRCPRISIQRELPEEDDR